MDLDFRFGSSTIMTIPTATWDIASPSNSIQSQNFNLTKIF